MYALDQFLGRLPETQVPGSFLVSGLMVCLIQHLQDEGEHKVHVTLIEIFLI